MATLEHIKRQAEDLEIDVSIDEDGYVSMHKRGGGTPRFDSVQDYDHPAVLDEAQQFLDRYRDFLVALDRARR